MDKQDAPQLRRDYTTRKYIATIKEGVPIGKAVQMLNEKYAVPKLHFIGMDFVEFEGDELFALAVQEECKEVFSSVEESESVSLDRKARMG